MLAPDRHIGVRLRRPPVSARSLFFGLLVSPMSECPDEPRLRVGHYERVAPAARARLNPGRAGQATTSVLICLASGRPRKQDGVRGRSAWGGVMRASLRRNMTLDCLRASPRAP